MSFENVNIGSNAPKVFNVVVEIPRGSHHKYEFDEELNEIKLDRVLHSAVFYPTDYGFIPHTRSEDGDHLDALVLITDPLFPGCIVKVRPIGVLDMEDEAGRDWKIIAAAENDPKMDDVQEASDIDHHLKKEIEVFFKEYKELENKKVTVKNWMSKNVAIKLIQKSMDKYQKETL